MNQILALAPRFAPQAKATSLFSMYSLWRSRRALAQMDDHLLRDIGLCTTDAQAESQRGFFDVPTNWAR